MKIGRNDPCHCGSGKKYKKCCLEKDEEAERVSRTALAATSTSSEKSTEEHHHEHHHEHKPALEDEPAKNDLVDIRWKEFEAADYQGKFDCFIKTLDDKDLMDEQMAFDMCDSLFIESINHHDRDRFDEAVAMIRARLPEVYQENAIYYLDWLIINALAMEKLDKIPALTREFGAVATNSLEIFNKTISRLAYHGQLSAIVEAMRIAWPAVKEATGIFNWAIEEFAAQAGDYVALQYVQEHPGISDIEPQLREQLNFYFDVDDEKVKHYIKLLTKQEDQKWTLADFDLKDSSKKSDIENTKRNLFSLCMKFLHYLHDKEDVSYAKADLARTDLQSYLFLRNTGELKLAEKENKYNLGGPKKHKQKSHQPDHNLSPDRETFDRYLARKLKFLNQDVHEAAALFEMMPAWLRFLETHQLIAAAERKKRLQDLSTLIPNLLKIWEAYEEDPKLLANLQNWQQDADKN